jgi:hypothetical protein
MNGEQSVFKEWQDGDSKKEKEKKVGGLVRFQQGRRIKSHSTIPSQRRVY